MAAVGGGGMYVCILFGRIHIRLQIVILKKNIDICKTGNTGFKPRITQESIKTLISTVVLLIRERFKLEKKMYIVNIVYSTE